MAAVQSGLQSLLTDALRADDAEMTDQALFQLGVVAFEGGHKTETLGFMERRLLLAQGSGSVDRIAAAIQALDILHDKLSGAAVP